MFARTLETGGHLWFSSQPLTSFINHSIKSSHLYGISFSKFWQFDVGVIMGAAYVVVPSPLCELESASAGNDRFALNALGA